MNLGEKSPYLRRNQSQVTFGVGTLPWHDVDCPKCDGLGFVVLEEWDEDGDGNFESDMVEGCDLCDSSGQIKAHEAKAWTKSQQDIS